MSTLFGNNWANLADFLAMGGRAWFVWGSYGMCFGLIALEIWQLRHAKRKILQYLKKMQQIAP